MFFDQISNPNEWEGLSDEVLARQYWKRCRRKPRDRKPQLIICFLMKRHKAGILLVSRKYMRDDLEIEEFTHELFLKLVGKLKRHKVKKRFGALLLSMVKHMHIDKIRSSRNDHIDIDEAWDLADRDKIKRGVDLALDFPLSADALNQLGKKGILSPLEQLVGEKLLEGYKPSEIADIYSAEELGIKPGKIESDPEKQYFQKIKRIYAAADRLRKKLKDYFRDDEE